METTLKVTEEEYLTNESKASQKSEYYNGEILSMAGAQEPHNRIVANLVGELYSCLKLHKCQIYPSDFLLKVPQCNAYFYPDISIVCEPIILETQKYHGLDVMTNPDVVI